ncbi:DUF6801 domain-containing protein [Streptomyces poonensis]|uniref:DUF6801 domain-containing protein n=1 Tax=Streptomyces poonensis TaxID=68255 RepID=A0A918Q432_9ACTN|nr:DUF6801 domain-containing protein [Streptomyces poonensis]GGZ32895.1 hypothetical protein GCM10010365_62320 [Streptomyces poonensis]GLJ93175.1 hypothetical protein GCM10017589_57870 [Streptomyces poonensis]
MRSHRPAAPRSPRVRARTAAIGAFVVLAAMVPAGAVAAGTQTIDAQLPYACTLPSGTQPATVRISADFPDRVNTGEAFSPTDVTTTVELPAEAVADLTPLSAATAQAATRLTVGVTQNEAAAEATWRGTAEPVTLPGSGPLTLTTTGDVPSVTGQGDGDLTFSAGNLAIDVALATADGAAAGPGSVTVDCTPAEDAPGKGLLATVPVGSATPEPGGSPSRPDSPSGPPDPSSAGPTDEPERQQRDQAPEVEESTPGGTVQDRRDAPQCRYDDEHPFTSLSLNAYTTGYSNVRKLGGASLLPVYCVLIEQDDFPELVVGEDGSLHFLAVSEGRLHYQGRKESPPFKATFLTFGFTPTTATMVMEQTGPMTVSTDSTVGEKLRAETVVRVPIVLRVTDLKVNGTPLDVGPNCRTEKPLSSIDPDPANHPGDHLVLYGIGEHAPPEMATGYMLTSGGPLTGEMTIPAFTGCGTAAGENLDRLLTASVSGPGNYVKQIQGQTCLPFDPDFGDGDLRAAQCTRDLQPYVIPVPER